jgi:hypothetical protein
MLLSLTLCLRYSVTTNNVDNCVSAGSNSALYCTGTDRTCFFLKIISVFFNLKFFADFSNSLLCWSDVFILCRILMVVWTVSVWLSRVLLISMALCWQLAAMMGVLSFGIF